MTKIDPKNMSRAEKIDLLNSIIENKTTIFNGEFVDNRKGEILIERNGKHYLCGEPEHEVDLSDYPESKTVFIFKIVNIEDYENSSRT